MFCNLIVYTTFIIILCILIKKLLTINIFFFVSVNGVYMFLWLGLSVPSDWVLSVFGVPSTSQVDIEKNKLPELDNPISEGVRNAISYIANSTHRTMRVSWLMYLIFVYIIIFCIVYY